MTVKEFLRKEVQVHELCIIKENGYIIETAYVDWGDLFLTNLNTKDREVKESYVGGLQVRDSMSQISFVPVRIIEVE